MGMGKRSQVGKKELIYSMLLSQEVRTYRYEETRETEKPKKVIKKTSLRRRRHRRKKKQKKRELPPGSGSTTATARGQPYASISEP